MIDLKKDSIIIAKFTSLETRICECFGILNDLANKLEVILKPDISINTDEIATLEAEGHSHLCSRLDENIERVIELQNQMINILERIEN